MNEQQEYLLNEYVDGTLSADQQQQVEQWLAESEEARRYLADLQMLFDDLAAVQPQPLARDLTADIMAQVNLPTSVWLNGWLLAQFVIVVGLFVAAWPLLQSWITPFWSVTSALLTIETITQAGQQIADGLTAVFTWPSLTVPQFNLNGQQFIWLLGTAFTVWLISNLWFMRQPLSLTIEPD